MKRQILICLILISWVLTMNAQIYTPGGTIQGSSGNNNLGIGIASPLYKVEWSNGAHTGFLDFTTSGNAIGSKNGNLGIWTNGNERITVLPNGNVGIGNGTTNPAGQLSLVGANQELNFLINKKLTGTWPPIDEITIMTIQSSGYHIGNLAFAVGNSEIMRISSQGSVGIGTVTPDSRYKLDVEGTVRAKEIKVCLQGGCDFVFKTGYKLMDLKELEHFVKTNQHLPEVAPEKEMVENGVNMKELQMKLLQKIEELTLYTIEQNKRMEEQSEKMEVQSQDLKVLKEKIEKLEAASK